MTQSSQAQDNQAWAGKTILVTGGGGGLGQAIAARYARAGAAVAIADLSLEKATTAASVIGCGAFGIGADVSKVGDCARMVEEAAEKSGRLDLLVNAAGIWVEGDSDQMTEADWDRVIDVNLKGTFFACRYAIPELE